MVKVVRRKSYRMLYTTPEFVIFGLIVSRRVVLPVIEGDRIRMTYDRWRK